MADVVINVNGGQCNAVPIRRAGGFIDLKPRPKKVNKMDKVEDTLLKSIRTECLAIRYYEQLDCPDEAASTKENVMKLVFMLVGVEE